MRMRVLLGCAPRDSADGFGLGPLAARDILGDLLHVSWGRIPGKGDVVVHDGLPVAHGLRLSCQRNRVTIAVRPSLGPNVPLRARLRSRCSWLASTNDRDRVFSAKARCVVGALGCGSQPSVGLQSRE